MNIIIDINHPAQLNFFRYSIEKLSQQGHTLILTSIKRGNLSDIISKELPEFTVQYLGKHRGTKLSIIFEANFIKFFRLLIFLFKNKVDIGISVGGFVLGAALRFYRKPNIQFDDDPESKKNFFLERMTSSELFLPIFGITQGKIKKFKALKEWAYLSPKYFQANQEILTQYNLTPKNYIFVREVSTRSLYYEEQEANLIGSVSHDFPAGYDVVLSLEDKEKYAKYPKDWILLKEPIDDIHSLIYFSKLLLSSGDSMAREGAMLGVPSIYCGIREMAANRVMINTGRLIKSSPSEIVSLINEIIRMGHSFEEQEAFRQGLMHEWDDVTSLIVKQILKYKDF